MAAFIFISKNCAKNKHFVRTFNKGFNSIICKSSGRNFNELFTSHPVRVCVRFLSPICDPKFNFFFGFLESKNFHFLVLSTTKLCLSIDEKCVNKHKI